MAEGDVYTGIMCMSLWSNNRSCDGVVVSEYMSIYILYYIAWYITVCAGMVYIVYTLCIVQCSV